ncbi:hypothetical protein F5X68DRAFT_186954 [Plectosphaerella plurivora]|uniref:Uncharacterized protein n=1 Tax=Plectosphaerella plurivora TaxID=936078 RepID=A0A9P8VKA5_9PEZI|nr:hypothetical protein F5X68DRAFT_186954 [Plectosphaerella plurivora]
MHGFKSLVTLPAGSSLAVALVLPVSADAELVTRQNTNPDCAAAKKLASGIDANIKAQKQEQADVAAVKKIVSAENIDKAQFDQAKKTLVATVNSGIQIRENNQKITPNGNAAVAGLDKVATAQATELKQAKGLKGTAADMTTIAQLEKEFEGGIKQNQQNKKDALKGCQ